MTANTQFATLAQQGGTAGVLVWALILVGLVIILFVAVNLIKRWMRHQELDVGPAGGFTLADLRRLHREGKMSDEEFEATRRRIVAAAQAASAKTAPPMSSTPVDPKLPPDDGGSDNIPVD